MHRFALKHDNTCDCTWWWKTANSVKNVVMSLIRVKTIKTQENFYDIKNEHGTGRVIENIVQELCYTISRHVKCK